MSLMLGSVEADTKMAILWEISRMHRSNETPDDLLPAAIRRREKWEEHGTMLSENLVYWEEDGAWVGYLDEFPDYWTQGESLEDLKDHLRDLIVDLSRGAISGR